MRHTRHLALLAAAALAALWSGTAPARLDARQPGILDLVKPGGDIGRILDGAKAFINLVGAVGLENDQQVEQAYGESIALSALARAPLTRDEALNKYVTLVGLALVTVSENPGLDYQFGVLDSDSVDAFATPHGVILISRGAIRLMRDESELAGVLAHEIAHVVGKHGIKSVQNAKVTEALVQGGMAAAGTRAQAEFGALADVGREVILEKGYDKDTEFKADAAAVALTKAAGYDPAGLRRFLERVHAGGHGHGAGSPYSTHPGHSDRISRLKNIDGAGGNTMAFRWISTVP